MEIKNADDFRCAYEYLCILQDVLNAGALKNSEKTLDKIIQVKQRLREYARSDGMGEVGMGFKVHRRIIQDFGMDGYTELIEIPEVFDTIDSADEFFKDFLYREYHSSIYDCTGQAFTTWYKLFVRRGHWFAYHSVAFDV